MATRDPQRRHPHQQRAAAAGRPVRDAVAPTTSACAARTADAERQAAGLRRRLELGLLLPVPPHPVHRDPAGALAAATGCRCRSPVDVAADAAPARPRPRPKPTSRSTRTSCAGSARPDAAPVGRPSDPHRTSSRGQRDGAGPGATLPAVPKNLVIVESPAKARTIERYLGADYRVLASYGHVRDLPENPGKGKFGVDVDHDFAPEYVISRRPAQAGRRHREGGEVGRHGLPRHRPRPRGRGDRLARRRGGQRPGSARPGG